ncbi:MAG: P-II family nitrogen regulator [Actinobacteria bacterium]|nr:P-II family nitrogen regulator [Actinomycetota bacterium]MCG2808010.1 P-II family nitrogen regulator [Coriobacteriia bacterium]
MKEIKAIFRPDKLANVKQALEDLGHAGVTVIDVRGHGIQKGVVQQWRGQEYSIDLLPKTMVIVVVHDHEALDIAQAIAAAARTGMIGDGKIFIGDIGEVIRIRTGETGGEAL